MYEPARQGAYIAYNIIGAGKKQIMSSSHFARQKLPGQFKIILKLVMMITLIYSLQSALITTAQAAIKRYLNLDGRLYLGIYLQDWDLKKPRGNISLSGPTITASFFNQLYKTVVARSGWLITGWRTRAIML